MEHSRSHVGSMVRWHARKSQSYVRTVSIDLSRKTEELFGSVFGIFETETDSRTADALIAYIEDAVLRSINEAMRKGAERTREEIFEGAIYAANQAVARLLDDRGLPLDPSKIKSVLVSRKGHDVILGVWGTPSVLLFHPSSKNGTVRTFDLLDDRRPDHEKPVYQRTLRRGYTNVISGGIGKHDRLLLSSTDPRTLLNEATLSSMVIGEDPQSAAEALKETLGNLSPRLSFASLVLDASAPETDVATDASGAVTTQDSIDALLNTTSRTNAIMSPSFMTGVWRRMSGGFNAVVNDLRDRRSRQRSEEPAADEAPTDASAPTDAADMGAGDAGEPPMDDVPSPEMMSAPAPEPEDTRSAVAATADAVRATWEFVSDKEHRTVTVHNKRTAMRNKVQSVIDRFNAMTPRRKGMLIVFLVLAFVLNQGVALADWQRQTGERAARYERSVHSIEQKIDAAEASIIYRDQDRAHQLLDEATGLIATLPAKTDAQNAEITRLTGLIAEKSDVLRHAVPLGAAEVLATIVANGGDVALSRITVRNGVIWAMGENGDVYRTDPKTALTEKVGSAPSTDAEFLVTGTAGVIAISADGAARSFAFTSNKASDLTVNFGDTAPSLEDAEVYGPRLYLLDAAHNRILKHSPYTGGFGAPAQYLKDGTDVSNAVSLAIDGLVYVLKKDGGVTRLLQGVKDDFGVQVVDPPVTAARKVRTTEGSDILYVLDNAPGRVLAFSKKTGALLAQYTNDELATATDLVVEDDATVYVTTDNRVLKFEIPKE